jgi:hypothetical protein
LKYLMDVSMGVQELTGLFSNLPYLPDNKRHLETLHVAFNPSVDISAICCRSRAVLIAGRVVTSLNVDKATIGGPHVSPNVRLCSSSLSHLQYFSAVRRTSPGHPLLRSANLRTRRPSVLDSSSFYSISPLFIDLGGF